MGGKKVGMRRNSILLGFVGASLVACAPHRSAQAPAGTQPSAPSPAIHQAQAPAPSLFDETVKPVLTRRCTPCHFPGGKMYERLPFDDPATVLSKRDGILRRLKADEDRQPVEKWIAAQPSPS